MTLKPLKSISIARYVYDKLKLYRIGFPIVFSLISGVAIMLLVFAGRAKTDMQLISSISGHLSALIETHDRAEMLKILKSIADSREVTLKVIHNNKVLVNTGDYSEMDSLSTPHKPLFELDPYVLTPESVFTKAKIRRLDGPSLNAFVEIGTPTKPLLLVSIIAAFVILVISFFCSQLYANQVSKTVKSALKPVEDLEVLVQELVNLDSNFKFQPTGIKEIDNVQQVAIETKRSLQDATDRLAQNRAKELVADAYRQLIHDLYTPVAALKEVLKRVQNNDPCKDLQDKMVQLASQVLNQVTAANENLGSVQNILDHKDIRTCVTDATDQSVLAFKNKKVNVIQKIPEIPILFPHDASNIKRAVSNLVSNALRACDTTVEIEIEKTDHAVILRVSDDGVGIPQEQLTLLLHGRVPSKNGDRPGIGLPSANHIARLHGGRLVYKDAVLGGACFEMRLG